jgi:hypothetical protein
LAECAVQVNERLDGSGYPQGLQGDEINEYAQVIGLVDMYEALVHSRPQREKFHHFKAVKEIIKSGKHLFKRKHLKALLNIFSIFPLHSYVRLNSDAVCKVVKTYPDQPMRPRIQIVFDSQQKRVLTERIINLPDDPLLYIVDSVVDEELQSLSEGPGSEARVQADRVPKDDDLHSAKAEAAVVEDDLPLDMGAKEDQADHIPKNNRLKPVLIIGGIALLIAGLIIQFGNKDSTPLDADKLQTSVMKNKPDSTPFKKPADISLPLTNKDEVPKEVAQQKPAASQIPDSTYNEIGSQENVTKALQAGDRPVETVTSEKPAFDNGQEVTSASMSTATESLEKANEPGLDKESIKRLYPYSIKLHYFRSREGAEKSIAEYRQKGLSPYWVKVNLEDHGIWYRVFTGYFEDIGQA